MKQENAIRLLRIFLGVNFLWFGTLKMFPGVSPAETLATMTISSLTFGLLVPTLSIKLLAIMEILIGVGLIIGQFQFFILRLFMFHMFFTFSPLFLFPEICFTNAPFALTIVGQYIVKNIVFIVGGMIICIDLKSKMHPVCDEYHRKQTANNTKLPLSVDNNRTSKS